MSVATDGMDSSKTNIPHFKVKSKVSLFQHQLSKFLKKAERSLVQIIMEFESNKQNNMMMFGSINKWLGIFMMEINKVCLTSTAGSRTR